MRQRAANVPSLSVPVRALLARCGGRDEHSGAAAEGPGCDRCSGANITRLVVAGNGVLPDGQARIGGSCRPSLPGEREQEFPGSLISAVLSAI